MTILQIIVWWLIGETIAWGLWWIVAKKMFVDKAQDAGKAVFLNAAMSRYPGTQNRCLEWLRFIIWPYGVAQRTIWIRKLYKEIMKNWTP